VPIRAVTQGPGPVDELGMRIWVGKSLLGATLVLGACGGGSGNMVAVDAATPDGAVDVSPDTRVDARRDTSPGGDGMGQPSPDTGPLVWGAFGPIESPTQVLLEVALTSVPEAGGPTIADLNAMPNAVPELRVPVIFQSGDYGMGLSAPNGTIELRGATSRRSPQKSYSVKLADAEPAWGGTHTIFLNKHPYDLTRLRNKLSFDLFAALPELKTLRTAWVHMTIDGQDYGLFTQVEHVGPRFLRERGFGEGAALYKAKVFEFVKLPQLKLASDPTYDKVAFEQILEIKGSKDHIRLLDMINAVNDGNLPINDVIARFFDRKNYLTWLAVNILTRNLDTTSQNFYLANQAGTDLWSFVPWDYDGGWGFYEQPAEAGAILPRWRAGLANWWAPTLHRRFLSDPANLQQLSERVDQLAATFFTAERIKALTDAYKPLVRAAIFKAPDLARLPTGPDATDKMAVWEAEVDRLLTIVAQERTAFHDLLQRPMPFFLGRPVVADGSIMFSWQRSDDLQGDAVLYDLEISTTPDFATLAFTRTGYSDTFMLVSQELPAGTYYWRVTARDGTAADSYQVAFDEVRIDTTRYMGVGSFVVP
jgi:spore coat protein H